MLIYWKKNFSYNLFSIFIKFLTVQDTKFCFHLASKKKELLDKAKEWLKEALKEFGIGAKTSLGYGIFENVRRI